MKLKKLTGVHWVLIIVSILFIGSLFIVFFPKPAPPPSPRPTPAADLDSLHVFHYPGLSWGATVDEVKEKFGLSENPGPLDPFEVIHSISVLETGSADFFGRKALTNFSFCWPYGSDHGKLCNVTVRIPLPFEQREEEYDKLCKEVEALSREQVPEFGSYFNKKMRDVHNPGAYVDMWDTGYEGEDVPWQFYEMEFLGGDRLLNMPQEYQDSYNKFRSQLVIAGLTKNSYDPDWDYSKEPFNYIEREDGFLTFTGVYMDVDHVNKTAMAKIRFDGLCMTESLSVHYVMSLDNVFN